jgi:hypothetical protein
MTPLIPALLALLLATHADAEAVPALPGTICAPDGRLAWVSVRHALDESGRLKTNLVDSPLLRANARLNAAAAGAGECRAFLGTHPEHFKSTASLRDAAAGAELIVSGRVLAIEEGFLHNLPGSLLSIAGSAIKGSATEEVYLFYPYARIRTVDGLVCARPVGEFQPPAAGDHLIIFSMNPALVSGFRTILQVDPTRALIHQSAAGRRFVPAAFTRELDQGLTLEEVETRVAGAARENAAADVTSATVPTPAPPARGRTATGR